MKLTPKKTKFYIALGLFLCLVVIGCFLLTEDNIELVRRLLKGDYTGEEIQAKLQSFGWRGYITVSILSMLQIVLTFFPAEPVQVLAGISFGFPIAALCCTVGVVLGNTFVFILYKLFKSKVEAYFTDQLHLDFDRASTKGQVAFAIFILYFLPVIPYGMICFLAASAKMKYPRYIVATVLGSIPSVCIGVGLGHVAFLSGWTASIIIFAVLLVCLAIFMYKKNAVIAKINAYLDRPPYSSKTTVRKYKPRKLLLPFWISRIIMKMRGVRVQYTDKVGKNLQTPCIVLCNHGAFVDFVYAGTLLRKKSPNFIVARMYFYKKWFGKLLKSFGCFPKGMFTADLESAKNCLRVLKSGGVLAMMPEARLSTAGKFEDIQPGTYAFLKKAGVPIYMIKMHGDYFASPKWGDGLRRGALVEAELSLLLSPDEIAKMDLLQLRAYVEEKLFYDEFEWIKAHPELSYSSDTLAQGLENILLRCPKCQKKYTLTTKGRAVHCDTCGKLATLDCRYAFDADAPFANFSLWYDWQKECMEKEILSNPDYALTSQVEFHLPSKDAKTTLRRVGEGICTLDRSGLTYRGTCDEETVELQFPLTQIYRLLFGAGENFEIYVGSELHYFVPQEKRSAVEWYLASMILYDEMESKREVS